MFTILLFPNSKELDKIERIRLKYDPLALKLPAHVTLVFPKEYSSIKQVIDVLECMTIKAFQVMPKGFTASYEQEKNYLFLRFTSEQELTFLHNTLYEKLFGCVSMFTYIPHITVGCFSNKEDCDTALKNVNKQDFKMPIFFEELCIERIEENDESTIIYRKKLSKDTCS